MTYRLSLVVLALAALALPLGAQSITQSLTPGSTGTTIDPDLMALGPTSASAMNTQFGTNLVNFVVAPSSAAAGLYSTNICGNAICALPGTAGAGLGVIDTTPNGPFDAFNATIDFVPGTTEVGFDIGDWIGPMVVDFYSGGSFVTTATTFMNYGACPGTVYYAMTGGTFDQITVRASTPFGNWVFTEFWVQGGGGPACSLSLSGSCMATLTISGSGWQAGGKAGILVDANAGAYVLNKKGCSWNTGLTNGFTVGKIVDVDGAGNINLSASGAKVAAACGWNMTAVGWDTAGNCCESGPVIIP